jgi:integrase
MAHIEKQRGKYRARFTDPLGRVHSKSFARKMDAERFLREVQVDKDRGLWVDPRDAQMPLAQWAQTFLSLCRRLSPTTQETYRRDIERYILPRLGARRIGQLPAEEIETWLNDEIASGIAPSSVHRHYRTLRRMLQVAVEKQKLVTNPCDRVDAPRVHSREMLFLDWDQSVRLADAHSARYRTLIFLAVDSGMRWSELVGLRRDRVEIRNRKVRVTEQLVQLADGSFLRKPPKTSAGVRSVTIATATASLLQQHMGQYVEPVPDALVFPNAAGNPLSSSSFLTHHFRKAQEATGIRCRFHDLRHTSVALAIASGAHPKAIQARMGHSSINVTLDRYGHLFPELDHAIADAFDAEWRAAKSRADRIVVQGRFDRT